MFHSLYLHLPFCRSKCRYCDFYSETVTDELLHRYIDALAVEWEMRTRSDAPAFETVYIGGGTPSLLTVEQWEILYRRLLSRLPVKTTAEWTVECNPESFTEKKAELFARIGVNRLTFGIQSLDERVLRMLGRPHSAITAKTVLDNAALRNFRSIGVDVMYGLPGQTAVSFAATLQSLLCRNNVGHVSAYELSIAEHTPFGRHRRMLPLPDEDTVATMTEILLTTAKRQGFIQYEISNFAREGHICRHNTGYWEYKEYLGLGASAHSHRENRRSWNVADIRRYCAMVEKGVLPIDTTETIDRNTCARELLFLGFRQTLGLNEAIFEQKTGWVFRDWADKETLHRFITEGFLIYDAPRWRPTEKGLLYADYLARELF